MADFYSTTKVISVCHRSCIYINLEQTAQDSGFGTTAQAKTIFYVSYTRDMWPHISTDHNNRGVIGKLKPRISTFRNVYKVCPDWSVGHSLLSQFELAVHERHNKTTSRPESSRNWKYKRMCFQSPGVTNKGYIFFIWLCNSST